MGRARLGAYRDSLGAPSAAGRACGGGRGLGCRGRESTRSGGGAAEVVQLGAREALSWVVAIEHSCHACGLALGRIRAPLDPIYRLPVVVCPGCHAACVRRRHPLSELWRSLGRWRAAIWGLAWRGALGVLIVILWLACLSALESSLEQYRLTLPELCGYALGEKHNLVTCEGWLDDHGVLYVVLAAGSSIAAGTMATAGLPHIRRRWVVWALLAGATACLPLWMSATAWVDDRANGTANWENARAELKIFERIFVLGLLIAPLGIPFGLRLRRAMDKRTGRRVVKKLARARRRRMSA